MKRQSDEEASSLDETQRKKHKQPTLEEEEDDEEAVTGIKRHQRPMLITKLVSGGQTGADRAALEAAESLGIATGGWAPRDFQTCAGKDLSLKTRFHLTELVLHNNQNGGLPSMAQSYIARSQKNVDCSDGTLAFRLKASVGTDKTIGYCLTQRWKEVSRFDIETRHKPCLVITDLHDCHNVTRIRQFIRQYKIETLNVAGHRDEVVEGFSRGIKSVLCEALTMKI